MAEGERGQGLLGKYEVQRVDDDQGKHDECRYFVLDPQHDPIARKALRSYANEAYAEGYETLALDLNDWLGQVGGGLSGG